MTLESYAAIIRQRMERQLGADWFDVAGAFESLCRRHFDLGYNVEVAGEFIEARMRDALKANGMQ